MTDPLIASGRIATTGLTAQSARMKVISENLANAHSTSTVPGGAPYVRKLISFEAALDEATGAQGVRVVGVERDRSNFKSNFDPGHPAADEKGNVRIPNVSPLIELADLREADRSYQANLEVIRRSRELVDMTIDLLKGSS
jgi:flagellar basal-body rod protein FlgC